MESLSAYARQFLGKMAKPEADKITGLPPAIAIQQKVNTRNPRSTVGTSTEIYEYLRLLFGRIGLTISPVSGFEVKKHTVEDIIAVAQSYPEGTRVALAAPISLPEGRSLATQLDIYQREGFSRLLLHADHSFLTITDAIASLSDDAAASHACSPLSSEQVSLLIDRLAVSSGGDELSRLAESAETAFFEGHDRCSLFVWGDEGRVYRHDFS